MSTALDRLRDHVHPVVFPVSAVLIVGFVIFGAVFTDAAGTLLQGTQEWITESLGWFMILAVATMLVFCLFLMLSRYGRIRLGPDDSRPDYSTLTWFAMLFSAGMGIGLVFFGVAEPLTHFAEAPTSESLTPEAARESMLYVFNHWGLGPWAVYAVLGLTLAYFGFRKGLPLTLRSALYPLIGDRMNGPLGNTIDILAILGTMFGVATSLGLGVSQINAGLQATFDIPFSDTTQLILIAVITLMATASVYSGLDKGIRMLSQLNLVLAAILVAFVALVGPTLFLAGVYFENVAGYLTGFVDTMFWTASYAGDEAEGFVSDWTVFYWAWWISWSPFVGMFIARISRGRTIREFVACVLVVPSLVSFLWFTVMGNTAMHLHLTGAADMVGILGDDEGDALALFTLLDQLPLTAIASVVAIIVIVVFFVTSSDSASFVIDMIAAGGDPDPPKAQRVFWALTEGAVAAVLLVAGGLTALQAGAVSTGLPFTFVLLVVMYGLFRALRAEGRGTPLDEVPDEPLTDEPAMGEGDNIDSLSHRDHPHAQPRRGAT